MPLNPLSVWILTMWCPPGEPSAPPSNIDSTRSIFIYRAPFIRRLQMVRATGRRNRVGLTLA